MVLGLESGLSLESGLGLESELILMFRLRLSQVLGWKMAVAVVDIYYEGLEDADGFWTTGIP